MGPTRLIVLLLSLMLGHLAYGQDITLTTQAEVDAFNPTLTSITGYLHINGNSSPDPILDLSPLTNLISIGGYLWIDDNVALTNVDGLSGVTSIGGYLRFLNNDALTNVDGLSGLTSIGEYLSFLNNDALTNVDGLSGVTSIGGYLRFLNNDALTNVDGLSGVTSIGEYLHIDDNAALTDVDGLSGLTSIGGDVLIGSNADLSDCCGIQHLLATPGAIGGFITIFNNPSECSSQEEILSSSSCGLTASIITYPPCIGTANGSMLVDVNGYDTLPIYYTWIRAEDGAMGSGTSTSDVFSIDQLIAGTYTVQVTTPRPDTTTQTNIVLDPIDGAIFEIIELTGTNSSNGLNNGSIQVVIAGGIAPYSYTWTGEAAGNQSNINSDSYTIPTLAHGEYLITVMDDVGNAQQVAMTLLDEVVPVIPCTQPLDIVILNDVSGSVDAIEYAESKQFFVDFLHAANIGQGPDESRAAIIEWSSSNDQQIQLPMTGQITELDTYTVMSRAFGGGTSPHEALRFGANYLESVVRPDAERVLILSTDGTGGQVSPSLVALADEYKAAGYHIATIAFDDAFSSNFTRSILGQIASTDLLAPGAPAYADLDQNLAENIVHLYLCPIDPGSSATAYFNRDGAIEIIDIQPIGTCPYPDQVEITFSVEALRELSVPAGTPVTFYHNNPTIFGATPILTWQIPCAIPVGSTETYTVILPISIATMSMPCSMMMAANLHQ